MTPTTEGKQLAADLANAEVGVERAISLDYFDGTGPKTATALARLATEHLALKEQVAAKDAKHEEALADLREIDRLIVPEEHPWGAIQLTVKSIAVKWRVETDPLVAAIKAVWGYTGRDDACVDASRLRAELSKRGYEIGGKS